MILLIAACNLQSDAQIAGSSFSTPSAVPSTGISESPAPANQASHLLKALSFLPNDAHHVWFTDWAFIKAQEGVSQISSASEAEERLDFFQMVAERYAIFGAYGVSHLTSHADTWGWDSADLDWETHVSISLPPGYVLKFQDGFDLASVLNRFKDRGFSKSVYNGMPIYSHKVEVHLDWLRATELSIVNTAVIADANLLILSVSPDNIRAMIDAYQGDAPSLAEDSAVQALVHRLGNVAQAFISGHVCDAFSASALLETPALNLFDHDLLQSQLENRPALRNYDALGIGFCYEDSSPISLILMHFPDANQAAEDFQPRLQLATEGLIRDKQPFSYAETSFTLLEARVEGNDIVFNVKPIGNDPRRLFLLIERMDMTFATCP